MADLITQMRSAIADGRTSAAKIADASGISRMQVYRIMEGENTPSLLLASKIARHLGYSITLQPTS